MSFISYAQNFEDVMLWRALNHIQSGCYIDVGAWSPDDDSVTRSFYEYGWRGVNIEPNPTMFKLLQERRNEDINLNVALSDKEQSVELYMVSDLSGLSTIDKAYFKKIAMDGHDIETIECQAITLNNVWEKAVGEKQVHFLKVDVEGAEEAVIRGNDWKKNRPWIVLVEATYPNSPVPTYQAWENLLLQADYIHVYSDGLNRFYVSKEHSELQNSFQLPPNIFDDFKLAIQMKVETDVLNLTQQYKDLARQYHEIKAVNSQLQDVNSQLQDANSQLLRADAWLKDMGEELQFYRAGMQRIINDRFYKMLRKMGIWAWMEEIVEKLSTIK